MAKLILPVTQPLITTLTDGQVLGPAGEPAPTAFTFWEILMCSPALSDTGFDFEEVQWRIDEEDQATGGTATASESFDETFPPSSAFDDNTSTCWATLFDGNYPKWLRYEFPAPPVPDQLGIQVSLNND